MRAQVYCGKVVGDDSDECLWTAMVEVDEEVWDVGMEMVICPDCGEELEQANGHFELIEDTEDGDDGFGLGWDD